MRPVFDLTFLGIYHVVLCFLFCCNEFLMMYRCNFNYNFVRYYSLNCALIIVLTILVLLLICWTRLIQHRNLAQMTRDVQRLHPRPLKNG